MRSICLLVFLVLTLNCFSQENNSITVKHDSLVLVGNDLAVLYKKSKSALYDISNSKHKIPYQKDYLHYFKNGNVLISVDKNGKIKKYDWKNGFNDTLKPTIEFEAFLYEEGLEIGCEMINNELLLINNYKQSVFQEIPLANTYGEDSIDNYGNIVYPAPDPEEYNSGIFNIKSREWEIIPDYRRIDHINEHFFVFHGLRENLEDYCVDWYNHKDEGFHLQKSFTCDKFGLEEKKSLLSQVLSLDGIQLVPGTEDHYYINKKGKEGLVRFDILSFGSNFYYEELSPPDFELVVYHPYSSSIVDYDGDEFQYHSAKFDKKISIPGASTYFQVDQSASDQNLYIGNKSETPSGYQSSFSIELVHPYALVTNITPEYKEDIPLSTFYGGDSIDTKGNLVYSPPIPGAYSSGVFDLEKKDWIIAPKHQRIVPIADGYFLVIDYPVDSRGVILDRSDVQTIYNERAEIVARIEDLKHSSPLELAKHILPSNSINYSSYQQEPTSLIESSFYDPSNVFFNAKKNGLMDVFQVQLGYENQISAIKLLNSHDSKLVLPIVPSGHGDFPSPPMTLFTERDGVFEVHVKNHFSKFSDSSILVHPVNSPGLFEITYPNGVRSFQDGNVQLIYKDSSNTSEVKLGLIIEKDGALRSLTIDQEVYNGLLKSFYDPIHFKITHSNDNVILQNSPLKYTMSSLLYVGENGYDEIINLTHFEKENSCIWSKRNDDWIKQGKNYTSLTAISYGFIGRTAEIRNEIESYITEGLKEEIYDSIIYGIKDIEATHELLDSSFAPFTYESKSSFSTIKEHPFGYHLFLNPKESILINVKGELLCEDHFDKYYLEDGVLYGENEIVYKIDPEFGDYIFDDQGNPLVLREAEKREIKR